MISHPIWDCRFSQRIFIWLLVQTLSLIFVGVAVGAETARENVELGDNTDTISSTILPTLEIADNQPSTTVKILTPTAESILDDSSNIVIIQFAKGATVELRVNGELVEPSLVGRTETNNKTNLVIQTWYGVTFKDGENTLTAQATVNGVKGTETTIKVKVRGAVAKLKLETEETRIPADGRSIATVKGQLLDRDDNRANRSAIVTLYSSSGEFISADEKPDQPGFQVQARNGEFTATLRSSTEAQVVRISAKIPGAEAFTQIQFDTALRQGTLLTGVIDLRWGAKGTDYYSSFRDFLPADRDNGNRLDISSAVFATGSIGEWQFTGAYNSDRPLNKDCDCNNRLFRTYQQGERGYPTYGDSSKVETTAPSIDQVYFRLERTAKIKNAGTDYVMWGDYNTEEFATASQEFSATSRQLHGFKANYNFGNLQITGFYGNNTEGFQRDTLAPDGTSGDYFLSRRLLVEGSEEVYLELEELDRPGTVIERQRLSRGSDYDIDYDRGTLLFRQPILRTDVGENGQVLVRKIVVTYQFEDSGDTDIYGGRLRYHFGRELDRESWIGASYLLEDKGKQDFQLIGADAMISLGKNGHLIAEYAYSQNQLEFQGAVSGSAYRVEIEGNITEDISGKAFYRTADPGFSNNATVTFVPGQTRYGAQLQAKVSPNTTLKFQYDREDNFGVAPRPLNTLEDFLALTNEPVPGTQLDNSLTTISAGIQQKFGNSTLDVDWIWRDRSDRLEPNDLSGSSHQLRSRLSVPIAKNLTFKALNEFTLSGDTDALASDRTALQLDWEAMPGIKLSLSQNWFTNGPYAGQSITGLGINADYKIWKDTTITGRYSILGGFDGISGQGALGIKQTWRIAPGLQMNFAYEHVFDDFFGKSAAGTKYAQPYAVGSGASSLGFSGGDSYSVGIEYTDNPDFKASARFEHRSSSGGSNTVITANLSGKISPALTAMVNFSDTSSSNQELEALGDTMNLKVGLAYRDPQDDRFNALLRYEYRQNPSTIPETILLGSGTGSEEHIFAAEAIYAPSKRWEFYGKYAFRTSTTFLADDYVSKSTVSLTQLRATYRLGYSFDLVGEARWIAQPSANYSEIGFLAEVGYYLTPQLRLAAGYVFGDIDDRDFNGSRNASGPYLGLTVKLNGLLEGFGEQPKLSNK